MGRIGGNDLRTDHSDRHPQPSDHSVQSPRLNHFSHHHPLELTSVDLQLPRSALCAGCRSPTSGDAYSCRICNYVLDLVCAHMPRRVRHPAHVHSLNILTVGTAACEACGHKAAGFAFRCDLCSFEVHCQCAAKPLKVNQRAHSHPLSLVFSPPYEEKKFSCDLCGVLGSDHWLYRCDGCQFDAHIDCATAPLTTADPQGPRPRPPTQQPQTSNMAFASPGARPRPPLQQPTASNTMLAPPGPRFRPPLQQPRPGLLQPPQPVQPLWPPGLLQPPRPLQPAGAAQSPAMNQENQGSIDSVDVIQISIDVRDEGATDDTNEDGGNVDCSINLQESNECYVEEYYEEESY